MHSEEDLLSALDELESNTSGSIEPDWEVVEDTTEEELKDELIDSGSSDTGAKRVFGGVPRKKRNRGI